MKYKIKCINYLLTLSLSLLSVTVSAETSSVSAPTIQPSEKSSTIITPENLARLQSVTQAKVSPTGEFVAYTRSVPREIYVEKDGKDWVELYLVNHKGEERSYINGKVTIKNIQWSADGTLIYFLGKMNDDKQTALYHIAVNGGQAQKVLALKNTNISGYALSKDNKKIALVAKKAKKESLKKLSEFGFKAEVYEEELTNKFLYVIDLKVYSKALTPEAWSLKGYIADVHFSPTAQTLLVKTQASALIDDKYMKSQWHLVDIASQSITSTFATQGKLGAAKFSSDGQRVAILGAQDQHDPATGRLFLGEVSSGKIINWLPKFAGHVSGFEWSNQGNELYFIAHINTDTIIAKLKTAATQYEEIITAGTFIASNLTLSDSDRTLAVMGHTAQHPNEVFMLRDNKPTRVTESNKWLKTIDFSPQESITIKARDGEEIGGVLIYPLNYQQGQRYPLIMSVHGGPESHDKDGWLTAYSRPGQLAAAQGYAVFYPNYRGSTGKGVAYSKLGQNDYAGKEFDDLVDLKNHLVNIGLVNEKKVGITGGSYGGYASAWGATKLTKHFAASVMFVGISNQLSKFGTTDISNEMHLVHARSYPWDKWQWYLERSPIYWVGQSETPLLIMHGKEDPRVHPAQSMELYRYMKVRGKTVRLVYYPGEGHGNRKAAAKYDYNLRLMRWMDNYLKHDGKSIPNHELPHETNLTALQ